LRFRTALLLAAAVPLGCPLWTGCAHRNLTPPELYSTYCARCHGERGEGRGDALKLYPHLDLLDSPMIRRGDRAAVRQRLAEGYGPMPGFERRLDAREMESLIDFTLKLGHAAGGPKEKP
jgi:mono/diheme cytochrome c family protein